MMRFPMSLSALAAFVIALWLALAPPAVAAPSECPCFPDDDLLGEVVTLITGDYELTICDKHPFAVLEFPGVMEARVLFAKKDSGALVGGYDIFMERTSDGAGFCQVSGEFTMSGRTEGFGLDSESEVWACMRQATATCRALF